MKKTLENLTERIPYWDSVELFECDLFEEDGNFNRYNNLLCNANLSGSRRFTADNIRYAMALGYLFNSRTIERPYMFIGGIGVLGNIIRYVGDKNLLRYRDTHDLDVLLYSKTYLPILDSLFNGSKHKSLSLKDKLCYWGSSHDSEGKELISSSMDVYVPRGKPKDGIRINGFIFSQEEWDNKKEVDFFGTPICIADPVSLLRLKLKITGNSDERREKDHSDIKSLIAVTEKDGIEPNTLLSKLGEHPFSSLQIQLNDICQYETIISPTESYVNAILETEVEEK